MVTGIIVTDGDGGPERARAVCFGPEADMTPSNRDVRYTPPKRTFVLKTIDVRQVPIADISDEPTRPLFLRRRYHGQGECELVHTLGGAN